MVDVHHREERRDECAELRRTRRATARSMYTRSNGERPDAPPAEDSGGPNRNVRHRALAGMLTGKAKQRDLLAEIGRVARPCPQSNLCLVKSRVRNVLCHGGRAWALRSTDVRR